MPSPWPSKPSTRSSSRRNVASAADTYFGFMSAGMPSFGGPPDRTSSIGTSCFEKSQPHTRAATTATARMPAIHFIGVPFPAGPGARRTAGFGHRLRLLQLRRSRGKKPPMRSKGHQVGDQSLLFRFREFGERRHVLERLLQLAAERLFGHRASACRQRPA